MSEKGKQASQVDSDNTTRLDVIQNWQGINTDDLTYNLEVKVKRLLAEIYHQAVKDAQTEDGNNDLDEWEVEKDVSSEDAEEYKDEKPLQKIKSIMVDELDDIHGEDQNGSQLAIKGSHPTVTSQQISNEKASIEPALSIDDGVAELLYKGKQDS